MFRRISLQVILLLFTSFLGSKQLEISAPDSIWHVHAKCTDSLSFFFWVHLDTLMMQCQIRGIHTKTQRWTKLWWQSHYFQDILWEPMEHKTKAFLTRAKVVAYARWLTVRYICLFSHVLLQESLIPWQHSPHTYVHSGKRTERKPSRPTCAT